MSVDMYMKIEGIDGESTDAKHDKWFEILAFAHHLSQPVSGASRTGGRTGGRADFGDVMVSKTVDAGTPDLNLFCCNGKHIPKIEVEFCLATEDKHTFMKYELSDVIITSYSTGGAAADDARPTEEVSFAYGKIKWEYTPIDHTGKAGAAIDRTWILETNEQG